MKAAVDGALGRVTMYRFVTLSLAVLTGIAFVLGALGELAYRPAALASTLVVLMVVTVVSGKAFAALFRTTAHTESSLITALLLFFILSPTTDVSTLGQVAVAALFASGSKYLLAVRGRHIFNPAAVGAVWLGVFHFYLAYWWVGSPVLLPFTAVLALLVLYRTRRFPLAMTFLAVAAAILITRSLTDGATLGAALKFAFAQTPVVFFLGFMLTEPLTLPPLRWQQLSVAVLVAVLFAVPVTVGGYPFGPETALVVGNALAFVFGQRRGIDLVLSAKRQLTPTCVEYTFATAAPVRFIPGQYLELALPHRRTDSRGTRRSFSITSTPGPAGGSPTPVSIAVKLPQRSSSFKRALEALPTGGTITATGVGGHFLLPRDAGRPLLLVAGGIGITPFISQLGALPAGHGRDVVLVYVAGDIAEIGYRDELAAAGVRTVVISRVAPTGLPANFTSVVAARLDRDVLAEVVPDIGRRDVYVSGPPGLVTDIAAAARALKAHRISTDYFSGY